VRQARVDSRLERYLAFDRVSRPYLEWQLETFRPYLGRRVLEVGCGVGSVLELLGPRERLFGLDVDAEILAAAVARFRGRSEFGFACLDAAHLSAADLDRLRAERFDTLVSLNVLEHIEDDAAALRAFAALLPSGGTLALLVPAHPALYGPYDALDGHHRRYSRRALAARVEAAGFELVELRYHNAVGALGWLVQYKLLRRTIHGEGHIELMNRAVPLVRALERRLAPPFGLSVVAVGRRRAW
jgi:SAM-dependent methyltransferase